MKRLFLKTTLACTALLGVQTQAEFSGRTSRGAEQGFAGPTATTAQLQEDAADKEPVMRFPVLDRRLAPWFGWKTGLQEDLGLHIGFAYTTLFQGANDAPANAEDYAASGIGRFSGYWALIDRKGANTGQLVFSTDVRHRYTAIPPADLGFEVGYLGIPGALFNNLGWVLGDLNWQQAFNDGRSGLIVGRYDPNDFFDVLGYANPWTTFQNLAILFDPSIALPDWSTGIGGGHWITDQWFLKAAVNDVNGTATDVQLWKDWDELYTTAELGWTPGRRQRFLKNLHVMGWHADERVEAEVEDGKGIALGANWTWDERFMLFSKAGWSDGTAPLYNTSLTAGFMYHVAQRSDLWGFGLNWGDPSDSNSEDQISTELFYRLQFAENLAITPSLQWLGDPALNPDEDQIWIASLRLRLTL